MVRQLLIPFDLIEHHYRPTSSQQNLLLAYLKKGPLSTIAAREELGIMSPSARVSELRSLGYIIKTKRISLSEESGRNHRQVALYLMGTPEPARSLLPEQIT